MYKIGLLYCKNGQSLEEEMYNNGMCVSLYVCMCFCVCTCVYVHAVYMCVLVRVYTCTCVYVCVLFVCTVPLKGNVALTLLRVTRYTRSHNESTIHLNSTRHYRIVESQLSCEALLYAIL